MCIRDSYICSWRVVSVSYSVTATLNRATTVQLRSPKPWLQEAEIALQRNLPHEASTALRESEALDPKDPHLWVLVTRTQIRLGNLDAARKALQTARRLRRSDPEVRALRRGVLQDLYKDEWWYKLHLYRG